MATLRVLVVDDNPQDRALISRALRREYEQIDILTAIDQKQLDTVLDAGGFELVVTDFQLLWTDGLQVLSAVRRRWPECPVIMFTATGSEEVAVEAMKHGLDDYIIKNVQHLVRLGSAVRAALDRAASRRRAVELSGRLDALLARLKVGIYQRSETGELRETNAAVSRVVDLASEDDLRGRDVFALLDDSELLRRRAGRALRRGETFECEARLRDAPSRWVAISESNATHQGEPVIEGMIEDISDRKRAEEELRQSHAELAHVVRLSTMGELVAGIAHEINQPLGAISNYAAACNAILDGVEHPQLQNLRDWNDRISDQTSRATQIIKGLRQFTERGEPDRRPIGLAALIDETIQLVEFDLRDEGVQIELGGLDAELVIEVDRVQIQQVLFNLIRNGSQAMREVPRSQRVIALDVAQADQELRFTVRDRGSGIDPDQLETLFEPFATSRLDGMGMGLAISARIVKEHGGAIEARNGERGAVFEFTIRIDGQAQDHDSNVSQSRAAP